MDIRTTIDLTVIYRRSYSHFVFWFVLEKQLNDIYIMPKRQTAVRYCWPICLTVCQLNPNESLSVCLPASLPLGLPVCLSFLFSHLSVLVRLFV